MKAVLICGVSGQDGAYLKQLLLNLAISFAALHGMPVLVPEFSAPSVTCKVRIRRPHRFPQRLAGNDTAR